MISFFNLKKKKQCDLCDEKYPLNDTFHELRLGIQEGEATLQICNECADFLDMSADVINGKRGDEPV